MERMNWEAIGAIDEFLGAAVVVIALGYLAIEIRQHTKQTRLSAIQAVNASDDSAFVPIYLEENKKIFTKGQRSLSELSDH